MSLINLNGRLISNEQDCLSVHNRGFMYGDAVFESMYYTRQKLLFWEDHYFRLMASMRILRMDIPMDFTPEILHDSITALLEKNSLSSKNARIKLIVYRDSAGLYTPVANTVGYAITCNSKEGRDYYEWSEESKEVTIYKDHYLAPDLLSTIKSTNKMVHILGSIYAKENGFDNAFVVNTNRNVVEALNGNLFLIKDGAIKTPPLTEGCLRGIMRKKILELLQKNPNYDIVEQSISPFELQKADELFVTNVIQGIVPITKYKKKQFDTVLTKEIFALMRNMALMSV